MARSFNSGFMGLLAIISSCPLRKKWGDNSPDTGGERINPSRTRGRISTTNGANCGVSDGGTNASSDYISSHRSLSKPRIWRPKPMAQHQQAHIRHGLPQQHFQAFQDHFTRAHFTEIARLSGADNQTRLSCCEALLMTIWSSKPHCVKHVVNEFITGMLGFKLLFQSFNEFAGATIEIVITLQRCVVKDIHHEQKSVLQQAINWIYGIGDFSTANGRWQCSSPWGWCPYSKHGFNLSVLIKS